MIDNWIFGNNRAGFLQIYIFLEFEIWGSVINWEEKMDSILATEWLAFMP